MKTTQSKQRPPGKSGETTPQKPVVKKVMDIRIVDDVFADAGEMLRSRFQADTNAYIRLLWESNPSLFDILRESENPELARDQVFSYLEKTERTVFDLDNDLHILEKSTVRESIRAFKSIIGPINEKRTGTSALSNLWKLAREDEKTPADLSVAFLMEFIHLFKAVAGKSNIYFESEEAKRGIPEFLLKEGREASEARTQILDEIGATMKKYFRKYPSGLDQDVLGWRIENKKRVLRYYNASEEDWNDYKWHLKNVVRDEKPLTGLIQLTRSQKEAIRKAVDNKIPFGITPYYLGLMDRHLSIGYDHAVRAQVIPSPDYVDMMVENRDVRGMRFDFMGEKDTSPEELITRRYPGIAILKPYNTCAQICVYCQRNWEIDCVLDPNALASRKHIRKAVEWLGEHKSIGDVLLTGGDPMIMPDGSRVYEFHPWEKNIRPIPPYNYTDVPIYHYLEELAAMGENLRDYRTIWFYY